MFRSAIIGLLLTAAVCSLTGCGSGGGGTIDERSQSVVQLKGQITLPSKVNPDLIPGVQNTPIASVRQGGIPLAAFDIADTTKYLAELAKCAKATVDGVAVPITVKVNGSNLSFTIFPAPVSGQKVTIKIQFGKIEIGAVVQPGGNIAVNPLTTATMLLAQNLNKTPEEISRDYSDTLDVLVSHINDSMLSTNDQITNTTLNTANLQGQITNLVNSQKAGILIKSPLNGSRFYPNEDVIIKISTPAGSPDLRTVEFFDGTNKLAVVASTTKNTYTWANVPSAEYNLVASGTFASGIEKKSTPVKISAIFKMAGTWDAEGSTSTKSRKFTVDVSQYGEYLSGTIPGYSFVFLEGKISGSTINTTTSGSDDQGRPFVGSWTGTIVDKDTISGPWVGKRGSDYIGQLKMTRPN